jgi:hypothetical protein
MTGWENFFIAEMGASAALVGLIFVGVSINLTRILPLVIPAVIFSFIKAILDAWVLLVEINF